MRELLECVGIILGGIVLYAFVVLALFSPMVLIVWMLVEITK